MERSKIAILIPVFNEESTISKVVKSCLKHGSVIIVDDCSTDSSKKILKKYKSKYLKVISNKKNIGYEKSLDRGFKYIKKKKFQIFVTYDADNQFFIKDLKRIIKLLLIGNDIIVGKRHKFQRPSEYIVNFFSSFFLKIYDPLCGLKGYNIRVIKQSNYFDKNSYSGTELLFNSVSNNLKLKQINIRTKSRLGETRFGSSLTTEIHLMRIIIIILKTFLKKK